MNLIEIMELQLLRSLVNSSPTLAGGESFKYGACRLNLLIRLKITMVCYMFWLLTSYEYLGTEVVSLRSLRIHTVLHWMTNAIHLLVKF